MTTQSTFETILDPSSAASEDSLQRLVSLNYFPMNEEAKSRLITEAQETAARLNKLNTFMASDTFPTLPREDKDLLYSQQRVMSEYVQILGKRIELAGEQFKHAS